jgi:FeS assembly SUF system protein
MKTINEDLQNIMLLENQIMRAIKTVYDPEIPVDIYELGLIYEIEVDEHKNAHIVMTLTSPNCPVADSIPNEVKERVEAIEGVNSAEVILTFDPPWEKSMMSEEAQLELGYL